MTNYMYHDPLMRDYKRFKLTKKEHNSIFPNRKRKWFDKHEYFYNENQIIIHRFYNWKLVALSTLLFPITIVLTGLWNIKDSWKELLGLYNQKETGSFISEPFVWKKDNKYDEIMKIIKDV